MAEQEFLPIGYRETLLQNLMKQKDTKEFCDLLLLVGGQEFWVHKNIVAASSPYFGALLTIDMCEKNRESVEIQGISASIFHKLINFMYTGEIVISTEDCVDLLSAADMLSCVDLVSGCCDFLIKHLCPENCLGILCVGKAHSCLELIKVVEEYTHSNFKEVIKTEEFLNLDVQHLLPVLSSEELNIEGELQVFAAAVRWLRFAWSERSELARKVLSTIRLSLVVSWQLSSVLEQCHTYERQLLQQTIANLVPVQALNMPMERRRSKKRILMIGGWHRSAEDRLMDFTYPAEVTSYNVEADEWSLITHISPGRSGLGASVLLGNVYVVGGEENSCLYDTVTCYHVATDTWREVEPLPEPRSGLSVVACEDVLVAVGGWVGELLTSSVLTYSPADDAWMCVASLPQPLASCGVTTAHGTVYVVGGMDSYDNPTRAVTSLVPSTGHVAHVCDMEVARGSAGAAVLDGFLYVLGGATCGGVFVTGRVVEKYSFDMGTWEVVETHSLRPVIAPSVCSIRSNIYVIGGHVIRNVASGKCSVSTMMVYDGSSDTWSEIKRPTLSRSEAVAVVL